MYGTDLAPDRRGIDLRQTPDLGNWMDIGIDITQQGGVTVVTVSGEVDLQTAPRLAAALEEARAASGASIVVDLSRVDFLDSSGLGVLVTAHRETEAGGGRLRLVRPRPAVGKVLTITRMSEVIDSFDSLDDALG
jgi:anti-sigma B factor antagonist